VSDNDSACSLKTQQILFPAAQVVSGDTDWFPTPPAPATPEDADKDDYTQNCVGGAVNGTPAMVWQVHANSQNLLFADGHARGYKGYNTNEMTFRYDSIHSWE
jgi:prepilin-type processing-associated H-X9-DG protein